MSEKDRANLLAILDSITKIHKFVSNHRDADSFYNDEKTFDAVLLNFVIIGESVSRLSDELKASTSNIPWKQIKRFRNLVAHDYFGVDAEEVWQIIKNHLPQLQKDVELLIQRLS